MDGASSKSRCRRLVAVGLLLWLGGSGCQTLLPSRGTESGNTWGASLRPKQKSEPFFFNPRSREIEESLGLGD